jgi:hypothetical protein
MEPIRHTLTARLGLLKMYREDLDELVGMFQQSCEKVTISDSKYRFASLEEMKDKLPPRIKDLDIRGENPGVRFLFNHTELSYSYNPPAQIAFNELRTEEITDAADVLFYKLERFLTAHKRPNSRKGFVGLAIASFAASFWVAGHKLVEGKIPISSAPGFLLCIAAGGIFLGFGTSISNYLSLGKKRDSASFFVKYREDFAKQAVSATITGVIGTAIGSIIGYLIGHFSK